MGEQLYDYQDKRDAEKLNEWLQANHIQPSTSIPRLKELAPRPIISIVERLTFRHLEIHAFDLYELCKRVKECPDA
jgi:hypothetical protein